MTDLAQLGLSLDAKPIKAGLDEVDKALAKTATAAEALATKIKTATGQMAQAFSKVKDGGTEKQAASIEKMNFAIEHQAKAYRALLAVMREDSAIAKSSAAQRILLNSAFASATAEIDKATVAGAKNLAGLRSETAVTTSLAVAQGGLTATEKQLLDAKIRKNLVTKAYTDGVRAEITAQTTQVALAEAQIAAERKLQVALGQSIIAMQKRQNAGMGLSAAPKDLFTPYAADPKVVSASTAHTEALKREEAATRSLTEAEAARAKQAMSMRMQPILSTGSSNLPTKATSAFNEPDAPAYTATGIASVDKMRASLAELAVTESELHRQRAAGLITQKEYARGMDEVTKATNLAVAGNTRARGVFRQTASAIASATFEITGAVFGLTSALGILASPAAFGFKLLSTMEDTKLGMGAILISMGQINEEAIKLPKALELADGVTKRLQQNAMKYGVDMAALADTTKAVMASGLGGGLDLKQVEEIALLGSIAVKTIGLDAKQSVQEIRDLVAGGIQAGSSTLAVALGIGNKQVKEWREAGTLFVNLKTAMSGFQDTAILKQDTLNGAWTIFVQKVQLLLANSAAFDLFKSKLIEISNAMGSVNGETGKFEFNPELVKTVEEYYAAFKLTVTALVDAARVIATLIPLVVELGKAFLLLKTLNLAGTIGKGLLEMGVATTATTTAMVTGVGNATGKVTALKDAFNGIGKNPIVQVIGVKIAWEGGQFVGTQLNKYFGDFFARELEKINKLIYNFGDNITTTLVDALAAVFQWGPISRLLGISEFFSNMADEIRRGGDTAARTAADQAKRIAHISTQYDSVQSEGGSRSKGKVNGGGDRLRAEERVLVGADRVTGKPQPKEDAKKKKGPRGAVDPQIAFIDGLRKEADTLGLAGEALKRYEASKVKLSAANKRLADTYISQIAAFNLQQEAAKANNEEFDKEQAVKAEEIKGIEDLIASRGKDIKQMEFEVTLIGMADDAREKALLNHALTVNAYGEEIAASKDVIEQQEKILKLKAQLAQGARIESLKANTQTAKTEDFMANVAAADAFRFNGGDQQQADEMIKNITDGTNAAKEKISELDQFTKKALRNMQNSLADFFFDPFKDGLDGMLKGFGTMLQKMIAEAAAAQVMKSLFGKAAGGEGAGMTGGALDWIGSLFKSANGNAFAGGNVQAFASGGIMGPMGGMLNRPTVFPMANGGLGIGGEAGVEAVMPLKRGSDGKLGVAAGGGGGSRNNITVIVQGGQSAPDVRRAAGQGAREALGMINGAQRYR